MWIIPTFITLIFLAQYLQRWNQEFIRKYEWRQIGYRGNGEWRERSGGPTGKLLCSSYGSRGPSNKAFRDIF